MAALTSGSWTISFRRDRNIDTVIKGKKKYVDLKLVLASGEVVAAGVPMPGAGSVGLVRNLDHYILVNEDIAPTVFSGTASGRAVRWALNVTGNRLLAYQYRLASTTGRALRPLPTTVTIPAHTFYVTAVGW
ncbi:MAG TPA: hypothetical protein VE465_24320 [Streptosporangiaceae bacterium]|jgi:hypothetical protein|nr:hypothetical protein [Streptosporangiaceae bacterium]